MSMDDELQQPGCPQECAGEGGNTGRCCLGKQDSEFLVMKVGMDLGMCCLGKLWGPRNVKI